MRTTLVTASVLVAMLAAGASGMTLDGSGAVTDWGILPFSQPNGSDLVTGGVLSTVENDYAPIDYPHGVGHVPSYSTIGERFDMEEMHVRFTATGMQVLVVTSSPWTATTGSGHDLVTWTLGDLFIETGGQLFGIVTQSASQGLAAGSIYRIVSPGDTRSLQSGEGSYRWNDTLVANDYGPDATIRNIAGPWAVDDDISIGQRVGAASLDWATFDYGGKENGTFLIEYTFDKSLLGIGDGSDLTAKMTWGCGNDVIRVHAATVPVPEPATAALMAVGAAFWFVRRRRGRRRTA